MSGVDLLVAGGGPVGLGTAIAAAMAGMSVVVVEPRGDPVDKACGEGLMPTAASRLARLGALPPGRPFLGIRYVEGTRRAEARFSAGPGLGVRRTVLQAALSGRAESLGVRRVRARVDSFRECHDGIEAAGVRARWLAVADGLHSPLRRHLGLSVPAPGPPRFGLRRHYRVAPWSDLVEVHWSADAEAYVTPVSDDLVGVAVLCSGGAPYDVWLRRFPALMRHLDGAVPATPVRGAGPLRQRSTGRRRGPAFLVGDAAGYVDALTGEGIAVGLASGEQLVRCLLAGRPEDYAPAWRRASRRYRVITGGLLWARNQPLVRPAIVPGARAFPWLFRSIVDQLA